MQEWSVKFHAPNCDNFCFLCSVVLEVACIPALTISGRLKTSQTHVKPDQQISVKFYQKTGECPQPHCLSQSSLPVCCPRLIEDGSVTKGITQNQRLNSGRFVCVFSKFLSQKASQRSSKKVNLIQQGKTKQITLHLRNKWPLRVTLQKDIQVLHCLYS